VTRALLALVAVALLAVAALWAGQRRLVYLTDSRPVPEVTSALGPSAREVTLATGDGLALRAWSLPPAGPGPWLLVFPGNAGHRGDRAGLARRLAGTGAGVLLVEYRGYGGNPGRPSEAGLRLDALAARSYLVDAGVDPARLVYVGESLGAAVAVGLAVRHPPAGLVLRSPFTSLADVGRRHYPLLPVRLLLRDRFPLLDQVTGVPAPTAVVLGAADDVVPAAQSRAVADAAPGLVRAVSVPGAGHNDPELVQGAPLVDAVAEVLRAARLTG
jgi:uncharacterized protein